MRLGMFVTRQLGLFCALFEERSVSKAAQIVNISQPSASRMLKEMRSTLGDELFATVNNSLEPTKYAHLLYPQLREILSKSRSIESLKKSVSEYYELLRVSITGVDYFCKILSPRIIDSVTEYIEDIFIDMKTLQLEEKINYTRELQLSRTDFVIHEQDNLGGDLKRKLLLIDTWTKIEPNAPFGDLPFIYTGRPEIDDLFLDSISCGRASDFSTIIELVKSGVGYSVVPTRLAKLIPNIKCSDFQAPAYKLHLYWHSDRSKDKRVHLFRKAIVKECEGLI